MFCDILTYSYKTVRQTNSGVYQNRFHSHYLITCLYPWIFALTTTYTVWHKFSAQVNYWELVIICVLQKLTFLRLGQTGFSRCELIFEISESPGKITHNIFAFMECMQWKYIIISNNTGVCILCVKQVKQITFLCPSITITSAVTY